MAPVCGSATIVSLTPLPLERDSRTFRIAHSFAEAGWRSVVVEGEASARPFWGEGIEVLALSSRPGAATPPGGAAARPGAVARLRMGEFGRLGEYALYAAYRGCDWWRYRRPAGRVPKADLYYLHSFELHRAVAARGVPIIYDAHDFYRGIEPPLSQPSFDRHCLRPFLDRLEGRLVAEAAAVVTVSGGVAGLMEQTLGRRPVVIRNCHDERLDRPVAPDLRARLGLTPEDCLCVVVGNRKRGMAVEVAVEAFSRLPPRFHLAFVGRGYDADRDRLTSGPASAQLHFGNAVLPNQIVPFIRSADLGLVLYRRHSENYAAALPNGFFQAVAAGLPLVRAALPEIEAVIAGRDVGVCFDRLEPQSLADAVLAGAARAPQLRPAAAALGRELRWQSEAERLLPLVAGALRSRALPAGTALQGVH